MCGPVLHGIRVRGEGKDRHRRPVPLPQLDRVAHAAGQVARAVDVRVLTEYRQLTIRRVWAIYHADDEAYFDQIYYWTTPVSDCGDDRGEVCKTYDDWVQGWTEVKG